MSSSLRRARENQDRIQSQEFVAIAVISACVQMEVFAANFRRHVQTEVPAAKIYSARAEFWRRLLRTEGLAKSLDFARHFACGIGFGFVFGV